MVEVAIKKLKNVQADGTLFDVELRFLDRMLKSIIPASAPNATIPKNENA